MLSLERLAFPDTLLSRTVRIEVDKEVHRQLWRRSYEGHIVSRLPTLETAHYLTALLRRWGESAGAISAALQMTTNGGDVQGLFRGAFMVSYCPASSFLSSRVPHSVEHM